MNCELKGGDFPSSFTGDSTINQGTRGVSTTPGFVNGKEQILTATELTPLNRSPKNDNLLFTSNRITGSIEKKNNC